MALKKSNINQILGRWHPHFQSMKIEAAILDIIDKVENKKNREFYIPLWKNAGAEG